MLVNSSLPDLVKVGRTSRSTADRAQELSGATGVPTPFIVAYEHRVSDCIAAEQFVHARLEQLGRRQAQNREFFRASPSEVIRILLELPQPADSADDLLLESGRPLDDLDDLDFDSEEPKEPWGDLLAEAYAHLWGDENTLEDPGEALKLFRQAARLGSGEAYYRIGEIYADGNGVKEDPKQALVFFKEAVRHQFSCAYSDMAKLFALSGHEANYQKCAKLFVDAWEAEGSSERFPEWMYDAGLYSLMSGAAVFGNRYPVQDALRERAFKLLQYHERIRESAARSGTQSLSEFDHMCRHMVDWLERHVG